MLTDWRIRLRALFNRTAVERELEDELRFHIEQYMKAGLDRAEAVRRARLAFGGLDQIKEECRDARGIRAVDELRQDVSYGLRMLRRRMLSSAAAIATLAMSNYSEFESASKATSLRAAAAFSTATRVIAGRGVEPAHIVVARVAGDLFGTLNVYPTIGRGFTDSEAASGAPVVVISETLWRRRWLADPRVVGDVVTIDGQSHTVVGAMPSRRAYPHDADLWRPRTPAEREDDDREYVFRS
jgi:putative ABC transport system permease protein